MDTSSWRAMGDEDTTAMNCNCFLLCDICKSVSCLAVLALRVCLCSSNIIFISFGVFFSFWYFHVRGILNLFLVRHVRVGQRFAR